MAKSIFCTVTLCTLITLMALSSTNALAQDPNAPIMRITQVDNSQFPQVTVYISVTNAAGEPIQIDPSTIEVYENGKLMPASSLSGQGQIGSLTTLLVIDTSGSMEKSGKMQAAKEASKAYIDGMREGDQAGIVSFNTQVTVNQSITTDKTALHAAVDALEPIGNTAMFDALIQSVAVLKDMGGRKAIILLSDGLDNRSVGNVDDVISAIGPAGLSISTIGLGDPGQAGTNWGLDEAALKSLAERAGGYYAFTPKPEDLVLLYQQRGEALQNEFSFTYVSPSKLRDGRDRNLEIKLGGEGTLSTTSNYNPGGVLPEVANRSWPLFIGGFVVLALLLLLPFVIARAGRLVNVQNRGNPKSGFGSGSRGSSAKGRIRLK